MKIYIIKNKSINNFYFIFFLIKLLKKKIIKNLKVYIENHRNIYFFPYNLYEQMDHNL